MKRLWFTVAWLSTAFSPVVTVTTTVTTDRPFFGSPTTNKQRAFVLVKPSRAKIDDDEYDTTIPQNWLITATLTISGFFYWYWMVFGAAAKVNGLPFIPDFLPMVPGWPPSDADLQPVIEDSYHFFYLSELTGNDSAPFVPPERLVVFNVAEAWIFAVLPALWKDPQRLPRPVLLGLWAILGINLTNAFLLPYLAFTAAFIEPAEGAPREKNPIASLAFGSIASAVAAYALNTTVTSTNSNGWTEFGQQCLRDRTYFAFCADGLIFSLLQPYILGRANGGNNIKPIDYLPFVGLMNFLFR